MARYTEAQNKATQKYHATHMEEIRCRVQKRLRMNDRIEAAANAKGVSKATYIVSAICDALDRDGVPEPKE